MQGLSKFQKWITESDLEVSFDNIFDESWHDNFLREWLERTFFTFTKFKFMTNLSIKKNSSDQVRINELCRIVIVS